MCRLLWDGKLMGMRKVLKIAGALLLIYAITCGAFFALMLQSPDVFAGVMKHVPWPAFVVLPFRSLWLTARSGSVRAGDPAPDFLLESLDHKERLRLSSLRGQRPVVLVFGSYT